MKNTLVIIPARGGSKGVPGKNIKMLGECPLLAYTLMAARALFADDDICISTDSEEIAECGRTAGLEVPFLRPAELATDGAGTYPVLLHALAFYERLRGKKYETVILLQPTSPFRTGRHVAEALGLYNANPGVDMVVSVRKAKTNPYLNCYEETPDGFLHISKGEGEILCRQDAPECWEYNGAIYIMRAASLRAMPLSAFPRRIKYVMDEMSSLDIDTPLDWAIAELLIDNPDRFQQTSHT